MAKRLTEERIEKMAVEIRAFLLEHGIWQDTDIYFNGKRFTTRDTSNGETMSAWWKDSDEPEFEVKEILEPCSFDDDGEPLQYDLIGFEEV